ncbi:thioredoxin-like protein [Atractiella rhizophila]|nr:thioredoxin-like protein [Atractiella rhizophila]
MSTKIKFYYDPVSPWAYIALTVLKRYSKAWDLDLELCPAFLGGIMVAAKNRPPVTVRVKGEYMGRVDIPMVATYYGIPFGRPDPSNAPSFPPQSLGISRFLTVINLLEGQEKLLQVTDIINEAIHVKLNNEAFEPPAWHSLLVPSVFSKERLEELIQKMNEPENKERVKKLPEELVARGTFGFPWFEITREDGAKASFFGSDRFEVIAWWLGKEWKGPFPDGRKVKTFDKAATPKL